MIYVNRAGRKEPGLQRHVLVAQPPQHTKHCMHAGF